MPNLHTFDKHFKVILLDPPATQASANQSWVAPFADGEGADRAMFMLIAGDVTTNTVTMSLYQATDSAGTSAKAITNATTTAIATTSSGEVATIEIGPGALDDVNGFKYVQARVAVASSGSEPYAVLYFRYNLRYPGLSSQDASYTQQVRVY